MLKVEINSQALGHGEKKVDVLARVTFRVDTGRLICLTGPSGCGKTTLLRLVLGLETLDDGSIVVPSGRVAAVFQEPRLLPWRSVEDNIRLALGSNKERVDIGSLIDRVGLAGKGRNFPGELSLGQARRAALARAFAVAPDLLLLDEPFASLDQETAMRLRETLMSVWSRRPTTTLMVTHDLVEAAQLADEVIVLGGRPATIVARRVLAWDRRQRDAAYTAEVAAQLAEVMRAALPGL
ncbi:ABC transporter ATP-binding protein [Devosia pacifica]|uniref:ABC transporter ATP-binding protein n=1 Tax=Devosia pacifica TaxID=1335967 RepID=A0A918SCU9_9HYPH|nr:ATP-binding cassette domain-containing protein [Devosia pacifica]GHA32712.1 ABC transporter ATP-binding protein [Devosia pacifica]